MLGEEAKYEIICIRRVCVITYTRWWQLKYFFPFHPYLGK